MVYLFIFFVNVKPKMFYYIITTVDILLYSFLSIIFLDITDKGIEYVFPLLIAISFLIFGVATLIKSLRQDGQKYSSSIYYAFIRSYMNYALVGSSAFFIAWTLWMKHEKEFFFKICVIVLVFEILLDFYWTIEMKDTAELLHHNHLLKHQRNIHSHARLMDPLINAEINK